MARIKLPSAETIVSIAITEIIVNAIWYGIVRLADIHSVARDWGFVILSLGVLVVVGWYLRKRIPLKQGELSDKSRGQIIGNPKQLAEGIYFYASRDQLGNIGELFANTSECYIFCFTGGKLHTELSMKTMKGKVKELILISPSFGKENNIIQNFISDVWRHSIESYYNSVQNLSNDATTEKIRVSWLNELPQYGIVISNPSSKEAWIKFEQFEFTSEPQKWPNILVYRSQQPELYDVLFSQYKLIRDRAREYPQCISDEPLGEIVSENITKNIQAIVETLKMATWGAYSGSVNRIFSTIIQDREFQSWCQSDQLIGQLNNLFKERLDGFHANVAKFADNTTVIKSTNVSAIYNQISTLVIAYRSIVSDFIKLLNNVGDKGAPKIWNAEPLLNERAVLKDDYDKLMKRVEDLKVFADVGKSLLPQEYHLTKFERMAEQIK